MSEVFYEYKQVRTHVQMFCTACSEAWSTPGWVSALWYREVFICAKRIPFGGWDNHRSGSTV